MKLALCDSPFRIHPSSLLPVLLSGGEGGKCECRSANFEVQAIRHSKFVIRHFPLRGRVGDGALDVVDADVIAEDRPRVRVRLLDGRAGEADEPRVPQRIVRVARRPNECSGICQSLLAAIVSNLVSRAAINASNELRLWVLRAADGFVSTNSATSALTLASI